MWTTRRNARALAAAAALMAAATGAAEAKALSGEEIRALISGQDVYLSTPYGIEFPLTYEANGAVKGDARGFSLASALTPRETGSWWIDGASMCQKWPTWYDGKTFCFTIDQTGPKSLDWVRNDGMKGTARIGE